MFNNTISRTLLALTGMLLFSASISMASDADIQEMKNQISVLTEELEKIKLGAVAEPKYESFMGLGPAASKVYSLGKGLSLGGYGEINYHNYQNDAKQDVADVLRLVIYGGYKFTDNIIMNSELEFEHAGFEREDGENHPEVFVEFSYLDFLINPYFNIRTGLMLIPIGFLNEYHEPTVFNGVLRPDTENNIIPTIWREIGIMAHGGFGPVQYKIAVINGMMADGLKNSNWIREGRQKGSKVNAEDIAGILNVNADLMEGLDLGGSIYSGQLSGEGDAEGDVTLAELHAEYKYKGLQTRGLYTSGNLSGNEELETSTSAGKEVEGWYLEAAYDIMPHLKPGSNTSLTPFARYEKYDTNKEVFSGTVKKDSLDRTVITAGIGFKPHPNVVIKADYQSRDTASDDSEEVDKNKIDQLNLGIGFIF